MTGPLFEAQELNKSFGGVKAVQGISMRVAERELRCIVGPNGAGKSTFFNMLCGTVKPTSGRIHFDGRDVTDLALHRYASLGICRKFQAPSVFSQLSVRDNLDVARHRGARQSRSVDETLALLELSDCSAERAGELSHGQKQWLEIGMALVGAPRLLLLDEPTAGMTRQETSRTAGLLRQFQGECAVIVIEHDMSFVRELACPTMVLHQGQIVREGAYEAIVADPLVRDIYLGRQ